MKVADIIVLNESVNSFLDTLSAKSEDHSIRQTAAEYLATMMVIRDMDLRYSAEDHPLKGNTMIDFLYGETGVTKRALDVFYRRIQATPKARILWQKYVDQFTDYDYGGKAMQLRIQALRKHFDKRKQERTKFHEDRIITNFNNAQDKIRSDYEQGETDERSTK